MVLAVKQEVINSLRLVAGVAILGVTWIEAMEMCPKATVPNSQPGYSGFCCSVFVKGPVPMLHGPLDGSYM